MWNIEKISVRKDAIELAKAVYLLIKKKKDFSQDFWLKDQVQRSVVSIASNIAEWNDRNSDKEYIRFLCIARWSSMELLTQIIIAFEIWYITKEELDTSRKEIEKIHKQLNGFIKHLHTSKNEVWSL